MIRRLALAAPVLLLLLAVRPLPPVSAADTTPTITLDARHAGPRELEEQTQNSIVRDYGRAWGALQSALDNDDAAILEQYFVGIAKDKFAQAVAAQQKSGVRVRYQVRSHALQVVFYSPEGSAIEARDTAQLEMQVLDGGTVVHSERLTQPYLVLFTPAEDRWKVRLLEPLPK